MQTRIRIGRRQLCLLMGLASFSAHAATSLLDIPLTQLGEVVITTARTPQRVLDTPGVISVISADEIRAFGANNLLEVVERFPGVTPLTSYIYDFNAVSIRGDLPNYNDTHLLILINGRPFRGGFSGSFNGQLLTSFPVEAVERVELIRGPGSVIYGSNAFSGVLNVITRESGRSHASVKVTGGSFGTRGATAVAGYAGDRGSVDLTLRYIDVDGWDMALTDENGAHDSVDKALRSPAMVLTGQYGGFNLDAYVADNTATHLGPTPRWPAAEIDRDIRHFALSYTHEFGDAWRAQGAIAHTSQDQSYPNNDNPAVSLPDSVGDTSESFLELYATRRIGDRGSWLTGGSLTKLRGELTGTSMLPHYDLNWWNLYSQASLPVGDRHDLYLGAQYNKAENVDAVVSPRVGGAYRLDQQSVVKLLYSEAFRSPFPAETDVQAAPIAVGNPDLEPEFARTVELRYRNEIEAGFWAIGVYETHIEDIVTRTAPVNGNPGTFINQGDRRLRGLELEGKLRVSEALALQGSATYQTDRDEHGNDDVNLVPHWRIKAGVTYKVRNGLTIGVFDNYSGKFQDVALLNPARREVNPTADAHHLLSVNIDAELRGLLPAESLPDITFSIYGTNLLDEDIYVPEYTRQQINTLPARPGRGVWLSAAYRFK